LNPKHLPLPDPNRRTGRTTKMLVEAFNDFYMKRKNVVVIAHNLGYASDLASMFIQVMHSLGLQPTVIRNHNIAAVQLRLDEMKVYFVSYYLTEKFWEGRKQADYTIHYNHYTGT
jgi:hypothetical protein